MLASPILGVEGGQGLSAEGSVAGGMAGVITELTAGLATLLTMPAKLGMLANELKMLSKLAAPVPEAGVSVVVEAEINSAAAG